MAQQVFVYQSDWKTTSAAREALWLLLAGWQGEAAQQLADPAVNLERIEQAATQLAALCRTKKGVPNGQATAG